MVKWSDKRELLYFRGGTTCFNLHANNWHLCTRVRAAMLGMTRSDLLNIGITKWSRSTPNIVASIINTTNLHIVPKEPLFKQAKYKYILDLDGGYGSNRKHGILHSGSVLFAHESPWFLFYEPLLVENKHYLRVDRYLENMISQVEFAKANDGLMKVIAEESLKFSAKYLTVEAAILYWKILLELWADYSPTPQNTANVAYEHCDINQPRMGNTPLGCSRGWLRYTPKSFIDAYTRFYPQAPWADWEKSLPKLS
jgi:hypothetical protein